MGLAPAYEIESPDLVKKAVDKALDEDPKQLNTARFTDDKPHLELHRGRPKSKARKSYDGYEEVATTGKKEI